MNTTAHTPTPYRVNTVANNEFWKGDGTEIMYDAEGGKRICDCDPHGFGGDESRATAQFIVEACNAHDSLKAQNAELVKALTTLEKRIDALCGSGQFSVYTELASHLSVARGIARAALAGVTP